LWKTRVVGLVVWEKCRKEILVFPEAISIALETLSKKTWLKQFFVFGSIRPTVPSWSTFHEGTF